MIFIPNERDGEFAAVNMESIVDDRGVTHGVIDLDLDQYGKFSCGHFLDETFKCRNCRRVMCYCAGHSAHNTHAKDACRFCDECCTKE